MTAEAMAKYEDGNDLYKVGFKEGWDRKTLSKKKKALKWGYITGGVVCYAVWIAVSANADRQSP